MTDIKDSLPLYLQLDYIDAKIKQSMMWANGKPEHDTVYQECCADFSCCIPELFTSNDAERFRSHAEFMRDLMDRREQALQEDQ